MINASGMLAATLRLICLLLMAYNSAVSAAQLSASFVDNRLQISLENVEYPQQVTLKELKSGLPNVVSLMISIRGAEKVIFSSQLNYRITYDLWDEVYKVDVTSTAELSQKVAIKNHKELLESISQITFTIDEVAELLQSGTPYQIQARILVNPVKSEQINKIRNWIASSKGHKVDINSTTDSLLSANSTPGAVLRAPNENSAGRSFNQSRGNEKIGSVRPRFQKLFDQILEQYIAQDDVPALWRSDVYTIDFRFETPQAN